MWRKPWGFDSPPAHKPESDFRFFCCIIKAALFEISPAALSLDQEVPYGKKAPERVNHMEQSELTIVIPAYNEAATLKDFLPELLAFCEEHRFRLIITDDCSSDGTGDLLDRAAAQTDRLRVFHHKVNRGYGGALITGLQAVETPYAVTMDADGQHRPEDVLSLLQKQRETAADMVIGSRTQDSDGGSGYYRAFGKKLIRGLAGMLVKGLNIRDLNSGMKLYDTGLLQKYLKLCPDGMAFSEVIVLIFIQRKHLVVETPITIRPRKEGSSTINTLTALETVHQILSAVMLFSPFRIFGKAGLFLILVGCVWAIPFLVRGTGLSTAAMLLIVTGLIFIMLGLIAEQLAEIRKENL